MGVSWGEGKLEIFKANDLRIELYNVTKRVQLMVNRLIKGETI